MFCGVEENMLVVERVYMCVFRRWGMREGGFYVNIVLRHRIYFTGNSYVINSKMKWLKNIQQYGVFSHWNSGFLRGREG